MLNAFIFLEKFYFSLHKLKMHFIYRLTVYMLHFICWCLLHQYELTLKVIKVSFTPLSSFLFSASKVILADRTPIMLISFIFPVIEIPC